MSQIVLREVANGKVQCAYSFATKTALVGPLSAFSPTYHTQRRTKIATLNFLKR